MQKKPNEAVNCRSEIGAKIDHDQLFLTRNVHCSTVHHHKAKMTNRSIVVLVLLRNFFRLLCVLVSDVAFALCHFAGFEKLT